MPQIDFDIESINDPTDGIFIGIGQTRINLLKEVLEDYCIDLGPTDNFVDYKNYLISNPIVFYTPGSDDLSDFADVGGGKLPIPQGFYSDKVLYNFISTAEGACGIKWVATYRGQDLVPFAACYGYDFPGGVHDPSYKKILGLTPADAAALEAGGLKNRGRLPNSNESYHGAVKWGWETNTIPSTHPYWQKLIPVYRDRMIWAWNQPIIQAVKEPAERLARMHSINWWGVHYLKGFNGGSGWSHRYQAAQKACAGMPYFT
jgi:hypothetical protein